MIRRGLATATTTDRFTGEFTDCAPFRISKEEWQLLADTEEFLAPFQEATKDTEGDNVTLDQMLQTLDFLRSHYTDCWNKFASRPVLNAAITTSWYAFDK
ncbi:hypothetical protein H2201_009326, partial [Coniosporium apollinis]